MVTSHIDELVNLLRGKGADTYSVEVKSAAGGMPKKLPRSISAFANGSGGTVILGLDEEAGFVPVEGFNAQAMADALAGACSDFLIPAVRAEISVEEFEGALIVVGQIPEFPAYDKPCYVGTQGKYLGSYIRGHDGDRCLKPYEIDRLEENKIQPEWDCELVEKATRADLSDEIVNAILKREKDLHPRIFAQIEDDEALLRLNIMGKTKDGQIVPTLAGLLAAGTYPQEFFPRLNVTFSAYPGSHKSAEIGKQRFLDNESLVGPIPDIVVDLVKAVRRNMRIGGVVDGALRRDLPDYPPEAIREAITNALMHRDYSPQARGTQVQVNLFSDRLEIVNPGGLYGSMTIDKLGVSGESTSRNQYLSALLENTPVSDGEGGMIAENRGSGYIEILDQLEAQLLPAPEPHDSLTEFRLVFRRRDSTSSEKKAARGGSTKESIVNYLSNHASASSRELASAAGVALGTIRRVLNELVAEGTIYRTEPLRSPKQRYGLSRPAISN